MKKPVYKEKKRLIPDVITPNKITIVRICMIPLFVLFFYLDFEGSKITAACLFALAAFTDFLDGYIARKYNVVTTVGKFLDPIADKVLVSTAFIVLLTNSDFMEFGNYKWLPVVMGIFVSVIMARELIISGFREIAAEKKVVMAAGMLGKIKTFVQDLALFFLIFGIDDIFWGGTATVLFIIGFVLFVIATALTLASGIEYLVSNRRVFSDRK